ncbi:component of TRAPP complex [Blastocystis sp. ATCC 50177/Nand II]|uniref:Trafficking protein particle complex subunit n=1 Tax=Blastocystis sp. subtype 1 (strain ATCC 50177 / NandII) TaxID=478820 RepID=A0A196SN48_BLAHN|nr:component of TRAPP complex [Blastocystis sp. ATCC 50177/Nand II]
MEDQPSTISAELLSLTYGAFISQIVKDYEDVTEINKQIDLLGYNMGLRLVEDYLSKTHTRGIKSFQATCQDVASKAFPMYTGVEASVENWNSDEQSCILRFTNNPLTLYVEIPDELKGIHYSGVYCGVIRGALEMIHMKVECVFKEDMLLGAPANEIKIRFIEYLDDSTQYMLDDE